MSGGGNPAPSTQMVDVEEKKFNFNQTIRSI